jgi:mannosyltransferase
MSFKEFLLWMLVSSYGLFLWFSARVNKGLYIDEGFQIELSKRPVLEIVSIVSNDATPPLYSVVLHFWMNWFGTDVETARTFSIICMISAVALMFRLLNRQLSGLNSLLGTIVFGTFPLIVIFGFTAQSYALLTLLIIVAMYVGFAFWNRPFCKVNFGILTLVVTLLLYTHNLGLVVTLSAFLFVVLTKPSRDQAKLYLSSLGASLLLYAPWGVVLLQQLSHNSTKPAWLQFIPSQTWRELFLVIAPVNDTALSTYGYIYGVLLFIFMLRVWLKGSLSRGKTAVVIASVVIVFMYGLSFKEPVFNHRYLSVVLPFFGLAIAYSLPKIPSRAIIASFIMVVLQLSFLTKIQDDYAKNNFYNIEQGLYNSDKDSIIVIDNAKYLFQLHTLGYTNAYLYDPLKNSPWFDGAALLKDKDYVTPEVLTTNKVQMISKNNSDFGSYFETRGYQIIESRNPPGTGVYLLEKNN